MFWCCYASCRHEQSSEEQLPVSHRGKTAQDVLLAWLMNHWENVSHVLTARVVVTVGENNVSFIIIMTCGLIDISKFFKIFLCKAHNMHFQDKILWYYTICKKLQRVKPLFHEIIHTGWIPHRMSQDLEKEKITNFPMCNNSHSEKEKDFTFFVRKCCKTTNF